MSLAEIRDVGLVVLQRRQVDVVIHQVLGLPDITSHRWLVQPCSAYSGVGLVEGVDWLVKEVAGRLYWGGLTASQEVSPEPVKV
jgi:hypothetical protein